MEHLHKMYKRNSGTHADVWSGEEGTDLDWGEGYTKLVRVEGYTILDWGGGCTILDWSDLDSRPGAL